MNITDDHVEQKTMKGLRQSTEVLGKNELLPGFMKKKTSIAVRRMRRLVEEKKQHELPNS